MKALWYISATISLLCAALVIWLSATQGAGPKMLAAMQLFILGACGALVCVIAAVALQGRRVIPGAVLLLAYPAAFVRSMPGLGNVQ
ncbi:hypothetical protein CXF96_13510 [Stenotrophomonas sp. Betaine-02u-21]|uniref:hypothetical protein n=1 Tax=unclassified Stenotrophomonas TaxID=196198 RepID=UPI000C343942|nr:MULTISPECIES: hypothetical protein [unclassified Stenotrophomonas]PKH70787.1 hypothetical protein CXF90_12755 [Stenotrophomonas sp. Betaine-02u-23]PKH72997.1 hypothetical protein CXF96_13510 [Stenotrophomonas sp. Betaine-02u-21]PKH96812.1 hypothetical protein CXG43_06055 [Stenotrophomonas sp. Bg11-02]